MARRPAPRRAGRPGRAGRPQARPARASSTTFAAPEPTAATATATAQPPPSSLPDIPELPDVERLAEEKKVLGFYMSSHPLTRHAAMLQAWRPTAWPTWPRVAREDRGRPRRDDRRRPGQERPEEPLGPDPDGQAHVRGPHRLGPGDALARGVRQVRAAGQERHDRASSRARSTAAATRPSWSSPRSSPSTQGPAELSRGRGRHAPQGGDRGRATSSACSGRSAIRPGNLDVYLEILGLSGVRRAIYRVGSSLKIRYDDRLIADLEVGRRRRQRPPPRPPGCDRPGRGRRRHRRVPPRIRRLGFAARRSR